MNVRLAIYRMADGRSIDDWMSRNADTVQSAPGVKEVHFLRQQDDESRVGALLFFESRDDMDAYLTSGTYTEIVADLGANWIDTGAEVLQLQFDVIG